MASQNIPFVEIENYIRDLITKSGGFFNRDAILNSSREWMERYPVEFNSILNCIENERRNDDMMDDSTHSIAFGSRIDEPNSSSIAFCGGYADDSVPSVAFCSRIDDDSTTSDAHHDEYSGNMMPDHISYVMNSSIGSDTIDSSPGGYPDDDFEYDMPLQRTMSSVPYKK